MVLDVSDVEPLVLGSVVASVVVASSLVLDPGVTHTIVANERVVARAAVVTRTLERAGRARRICGGRGGGRRRRLRRR